MRCCAIAALGVLVAGPIVINAQQPAQPTQGPSVFRATTDVVLVPVSVTDSTGRFVHGLTADQFQISDGGSRRAVTQFSADRVPVSLGILLDISGSMMEDPKARAADDARWADTRKALELLLNRLGALDEVLFAAFSDKVAAAPWTRDRDSILRAFDKLLPGGGTALLDALTIVAPAFQRARHQRRVLLLVSDGNDTHAPAGGVLPPPPHEIGDQTASVGQWRQTRRQLFIDNAKNAVRRSDAMLYAIGVGTRKGVPVDRAMLEELTKDAGGYAIPLRDPSEISAAVARICDDLQSQYLLAFEPETADGKYHRITVKTKDSRLRIRARAGYVASTARSLPNP